MTSNQYLTVANAIAQTPLYDPTNPNDVSWVISNVPLCNRQTENDVVIAWATFPVDNSDTNWNAFADCALQYFKYLWNQKIGNKVLAKSSKDSYDVSVIALIALAKSNVATNRRPALLTSVDPRDAKIVLPSQASIFAFDDYA